MSDIVLDSSYRDSSNPENEVPPDLKAKAYRYGSSYITANVHEESFLKIRGPAEVKVLGYMKDTDVPLSYLMGSGYLVTGGDSLRARHSVAAVSQALKEKGNVAVAKFVKAKDSDPVVGILTPWASKQGMRGSGEEGGGDGDCVAQTLLFIQMPFAEDVSKAKFEKLDPGSTTAAQDEAASALIDSLMLPSSSMVSTSIPNPGILSFKKTVEARAAASNGNEVSEKVVDVIASGEVSLDTPAEIRKSSAEAIKKFELECKMEHLVDTQKNKRGKKRHYWSDALEHDGDEIEEGDENGGGAADNNNNEADDNKMEGMI